MATNLPLGDPKREPSDKDNISDLEKEDVDKQTGKVTKLGRGAEKFEGREDPFANEEGAETHYKTLTWWQAGMIMIAETISLGILSLPSTLATIGLVPGIIILVVLGALATYTGYVYGQFKQAYPWVHNMADAGEILMGSFGREFFGAAQIIFLVFSMGSHILTFTIAMNVITNHVTCTIVWGVIGMIVFWVLTLPRTLKNVSWLSIGSFISIISAVLITMIGVGVDPPDPHIQPFVKSVTLAEAFLAVCNIVFAYTGHVAFFSFISELRDPKDYPKALALLQISDISMYITVALVVYCYAGTNVASPALGSTGPMLRRVAYGIALPTIAIAGVIYGHVAGKQIWVRLFRGTEHMKKRTVLGIGSWVGITALLWIVAWIIAESIPNFNNLLSLISSIFASHITYSCGGIFWLFMNYGRWMSSPKKIFLTLLNWGCVLVGFVIMGLGLYASGKAIHEDSEGHSWTCADNS